jgi:HSP20 family protein
MSIRKKVGYLVPMGYWGTNVMMRDMERMFDDLKMGFGDMAYMSSGERFPAVDIMDEGDHYEVEAELPGAKKEEVYIEIGEDHLVVKAERTCETDEQGEGYVRKERGRMSFYRRILLPDDADSSQATAKLENGLLTVSMPKRTQTEERRKLDIE